MGIILVMRGGEAYFGLFGIGLAPRSRNDCVQASQGPALGVLGEVGIPLGGLRLRVTQQVSNQLKGVPLAYEDGSMAVPQVVEPEILKTSFLQQPAPGSLDVAYRPAISRRKQVFGRFVSGQGALLEFLGGVVVFGNQPVGIAFDHLGHAIHEVGRVQPVFAQAVQFGGGLRDLLGAGITGVIGGGGSGVRPSGKGKVSKVLEEVYLGRSSRELPLPSAQSS